MCPATCSAGSNGRVGRAVSPSSTAHFGTDSLRALDLAERLGVPFVVSYHGFDAALSDAAMRAGTRGRYLQRRAELFDKAAAITAVSAFTASEVVRQGAPEAKLHVHHVGAPLGPPRPDPPREPVVLFVGRHVEKKGLGDLIEAMARVRASVPAARLLVVGDGPLRSEIEDRARRLDVDARFAGWLEPREVARQLREARVLCVPSRRAANGDAEGLPTVIPEAGGQGLPVVGTRHSGIPEGIGDDAGGLLADEGDVDGIARALTALLTDDDALAPAQRRRARERGAQLRPAAPGRGARGDLRRGARPGHEQVIPAQGLLPVPALPLERQPLRRDADRVDHGRSASPVAIEGVGDVQGDRRPGARQGLQLDDLEAGLLAEVAEPVRRVAEEVARLLVQRPAERRRRDQVAAGRSRRRHSASASPGRSRCSRTSVSRIASAPASGSGTS